MDERENAAELKELLAKARESALEAVRVYNDPIGGFRTETFIVLMVIAWNSLFQAILEQDRLDYYERDALGNTILIEGRPKVRDTWALAGLAILQPEMKAVRANLDFFLRLRHRIAHCYLPALDVQVTGEAQAVRLLVQARPGRCVCQYRRAQDANWLNQPVTRADRRTQGGAEPCALTERELHTLATPSTPRTRCAGVGTNNHPPRPRRCRQRRQVVRLRHAALSGTG